MTTYSKEWHYEYCMGEVECKHGDPECPHNHFLKNKKCECQPQPNTTPIKDEDGGLETPDVAEQSKDTKSLTVARLREKLQEGYAQDVMTRDYDGSCPCASDVTEVDNHKVGFWSRCWRVSDQIGAGFQDLYVITDHPARDEIIRLLLDNLNAQEWYNPYKIIEGNDLELKDLEATDE